MTLMRRSSLVATIVAGFVALGITISTAAVGAGTIVPQETDDSYADQIAEKEQEKINNEAEQEQIESALESTQQEIVAANKRQKEVERQLSALEKQIKIAESELQSALVNQRRVEERLAAAKAQDVAISARIESDSLRFAELQGIVAELARAFYRSSGEDASLRLVLGAADTDDFVNEFASQHAAYRTQASALAEMEQLDAQNRNLSARQVAVREYIEELKVLADHYVAVAEVKRTELESKRLELQALQDELAELKAYLVSKKKEYLAEQDRLEQEYRDLRVDILKLQREQSPGIYGDGVWQYPTSNVYITSPYGYRIHPIYGTRRLHGGTDFRAYCGTPIMAAADARVEWTEYRGGFGNQVMLSHGKINGSNWNSSYNHLSKFNVKKGDYLVRGDVVGYAGTTGTSVACHLHFEVYKNGNRVNPMSVLPDR